MIPALTNMTIAMPLLADAHKSFWFPEQASSFAIGVDWVYDLILYISLAFFIPMMAFTAYSMFKYTKKKGEKAESQVTHNTPLELAWSIGPSFVLVWMFIQGSISYLDMRTPPEGSYDIGVQAQKWNFTMDYGGGTFHNELHVVKDEPTKLSMRSTDVIHALFIPAFRVKKDIVPGRYNYLWFKPIVASEKVSDEELAKAKKQSEGGGVWDYDKYQFTPEGYRFYDLYCAEYCGKDHSEMQTAVVVHETQEELDAWIKANSSRGDISMVEWGQTLFNRRGCVGCHSLDGTKDGYTGPSFKDVYGFSHAMASGEELMADDNYIRESILDPKAQVVAGYSPVMPTFKGQLSDDDIASIIEFLKTLSANGESAKSPADGDTENADTEVETTPAS
ncbi:cytochrome c oxidase subunit II [Allorhodopirellula heiligendammensis]|uniref:Cytochrome c oxidase subunit 2 n=1 Tax=Allorhodopirellula heiligendammensis TaxID=2714739 RepID=A0A5C6BW47_9BACT|nr:cytochrome c oxidase subunit II [Allorhodopirellula heiligendammensis]TWU15446.1 Cytochrome c oxidase subunit 2 precursor [Allorhodopirellula heiligendammensis]